MNIGTLKPPVPMRPHETLNALTMARGKTSTKVPKSKDALVETNNTMVVNAICKSATMRCCLNPNVVKIALVAVCTKIDATPK